MSRSPDYLIIGNPENRRIALFQSALMRRGLSAAHVLAYRDLLGDPHCLSRWLHACMMQRAPPLSRHHSMRNHSSRARRLLVRLESPGENSEVEAQLIARGMRLSGRRARLKMEHGQILYPRDWFAGYTDLLQEIAKCVAGFDKVTSPVIPMKSC